MSHPFFPLSLALPHYTPRVYSQNDVLGTFILASVLVSVGTLVWSRRLPTLASRLVVLWFTLCALIHGVVEGYFVWNHATIAGQDTFLANLWKEYGLSDSRYMSSDPLVVVIEAITMVLWGPLSLLVAYLTVQQSPWRHVLGLIISLGQLYGDILYYATTLIEGAPHCRPEGFYFWAYFVFANAFWIIIPLALLLHYAQVLGTAAAAAGDVGARATRAAAAATGPSTPRGQARRAAGSKSKGL